MHISIVHEAEASILSINIISLESQLLIKSEMAKYCRSSSELGKADTWNMNKVNQ